MVSESEGALGGTVAGRLRDGVDGGCCRLVADRQTAENGTVRVRVGVWGRLALACALRCGAAEERARRPQSRGSRVPPGAGDRCVPRSLGAACSSSWRAGADHGVMEILYMRLQISTFCILA